MALAVSVIGFPVLSFLLLLLFSKSLSSMIIKFIGVGGIVLSCLATVCLWLTVSTPLRILFWEFLPAGIAFDAPIEIGLMIDSLSLTMALVVSFVSSLIAIYSAEYMSHEEGFGRFFAGINLFVAFMLILVLADSLWLLFIGWEGVGLASYLLIGFFYREPKAVSAAMKAFITTRVGDVFLLFAIFFAVVVFGTINIEGMKILAQSIEPNSFITIICLCLLLAASGKSAQLPLQTWLADAMWGPTPVSALIHAATMVTAGVYLLVRMSFLVVLSPVAQMSIMLVGLATLIMAGFAALVQTDMKRVLAYSTMSQIGYMFLAVGALAFQAAIFHLVTHAFFKALLFLSAGIIGHALHSYDLDKMGGLRKAMPAVFGFFLIGSFSLMGLPFLGAGFFSKEWILNDVASVSDFGSNLFYGAAFGTFLTALYTVRMLVLAFYGKLKKPIYDHAGPLMYGSVLVLAFFSLLIGWLQTPHFVAQIHLMSDFLSSSVPGHESEEGGFLWLLPTCLALLGALFAILRKNQWRNQDGRGALRQFIKNGWGFAWLYQTLLLIPYQKLAHVLGPDYIQSSYEQVVLAIKGFFYQVSSMHTGKLSHYLSFMMVALVALSSIMVLSCY